MAGWGLFLLLAVLAFSADPELVRDNDQAAMLAGSLRMAEGAPFWGFDGYAFDRSWLAYVLTAGVFRVEQALTGTIRPLRTANILTRCLFWGGWFLFFVRTARRSSMRHVVLFVLASPAALLASVYWNTTALASAWVALGAVLLAERGRGGVLPGAVCFGLATGIRADVILLAPLLIWLFASARISRATGRARLRVSARGWAPAAAMALALVIGRVSTGGGSPVTDLFFEPRVLLGYVVFGGGSLAAAAVVTAAAWRPGRRPGGRKTVFQGIGWAAVLLPWAFYLPQLHTPRYLLRAGEALLLLGLSPRGRVWLRRAWDGPRPIRAGLALIMGVPLLVGLRLPVPSRPRLTVRAPTLMPTGDGLMPMGAVGPFMANRLRRASESPVDHNQILWQAIRQARLPTPDEPWPVLTSPQIGGFELRAAREGATVERVSVGAAEARPMFFAETRMLIRRDPKQPGFDVAASLLERPAVRVSPSIEGISVVRFGEGDREWSRDIRLLRRLFDAAEYRIRPDTEGWADAGHAGAFFSEARFELIETEPDGTEHPWSAEWDEATGLFFVFRPGRFPARHHRLASASPPLEVRRAVRVFPDWMTLR